MLHIRSEKPGDASAISSVHEDAFPTSGEARLVELLRVSGNLTISLVAEVGSEVVGHVAFSPVVIADRLAGLGLAPVGVIRCAQGRGYGRKLIEAGLKEAARRGDPFVVVLGEPAYYSRFGFRPASEWQLVDEYGGGPAFQAIELRKGAIPSSGGLARYGREFASLVDEGVA